VDLSEPAVLAPAAPSGPKPRLRWHWRVVETASAYLPIVLMALLALGTWWLVKNTPRPAAETAAAAPRHEPDYTMQRFVVQRFTPAGRLRAQLEGNELRHYPDSDTVEIDHVQMRAWGDAQQTTTATARRALVNGDATQVQLLGGAQVVREGQAGAPPIEFRGEFLHAFLATERVRSHLPVVVRRGATEIRADALDYDNLDRTVQLRGRVRARFPGAGGRPAEAFTQGVRP
jgi:lipopolysaccharide export system protein LptC